MMQFQGTTLLPQQYNTQGLPMACAAVGNQAAGMCFPVGQVLNQVQYLPTGAALGQSAIGVPQVMQANQQGQGQMVMLMMVGNQCVPVTVAASQSAALPQVQATGATSPVPAAGTAGTPQPAQQMPAPRLKSVENMICRDYQQKGCTRENCYLDHVTKAEEPQFIEYLLQTAEARVTFCKDHHMGRCQREECRYYHGTLSEELWMDQRLRAKWGNEAFFNCLEALRKSKEQAKANKANGSESQDDSSEAADN